MLQWSGLYKHLGRGQPFFILLFYLILAVLARFAGHGFYKIEKCFTILYFSTFRTPHTLFPASDNKKSNLNKNRLSSTTCGEELQKIYKDWQSFKALCQKQQKITDFKQFAFLTFFDLQMTSKLKFDLIRPT